VKLKDSQLEIMEGGKKFK